jgi:O-antigen/teichoic acid export membrane protein
VLAIAASRLPVELFAVFALLVGLAGWLPVLDFGFGSVLQNRVAEARSKGHSHIGMVAASVWGAAGHAVLLLILGGTVLFVWSPSSEGLLALYPGALALTAVCLLVTGVSMQVHRLLAATQRLMLSAVITALQHIFALLGLLFALAAHGSNDVLLWMLGGYFVPYMAVPLLALILLMPRTEWTHWPSVGEVRALFKDSVQFWFVTVLSLVVIQFDQFIAYAYLTAREYAQYTIACKLINFAYFPYAALLVANWTRVTMANAEQNRAKVMGIIHSSVLIGAVYVTLATGALLLLAGPISRLLPRGGGDLELLVLAGVGLVALNKVWTESYALAFLATNRIGVIAAYLPLQAGCAVGLQLLLVRFLGVYGLMIGGAASYFATSHWILASRAKDVFKSYVRHPS